MKVLKENLGGIVVLTLKGEFDTFVTGAFSNEIGNDGQDPVVATYDQRAPGGANGADNGGNGGGVVAAAKPAAQTIVETAVTKTIAKDIDALKP